MKNRYLVIFIILLMTFSSASAAPTVSVEPSSVSVKVGDTVMVNILVDPTGSQVYAAQFDLNYISSIINATKIEKGPFLTQDGASSLIAIQKCDNGQCSYGETRFGVSNGVTTAGILAMITFKADANGTVLLSLSNVILADPSGYPITPTPTPTPTPTRDVNGGGGGGGGGGGASGEAFNNIEKQDRKDAFVYAGKLASYDFTNAGPITSVVFTGKKNFGEINVKIELLKSTSTLVNVTPPGTVYRNFNVWAGTSGFSSPENIENPVIKFRIEKDWLSSNKFVPGDIFTYRWDSNKWNKLETINTGDDDTYINFEVKTDHFSSFAISAGKTLAGGTEIASQTQVNVSEEQTEPKPVGSPVAKSGGFEIILVISMLLFSYIFLKK